MLKLWLPFIDGLKQQGISNATVENMGGVSTAAAGKIGACMSFTGAANSYLRLSPILDANSDCTIAFWVKFNNVSANQCIFSQRVEVQTNGYTIFLLGTSIRFDEGESVAYGTIAANTWYHIACCKDASKKYIYINGTLVGSAARTTQSAEKVNTNYSLIGGSQNSAAGTPSQGTVNALNGCLNDFRIYDNCLSAAEVKEIAQGLVLHYKLDGGLFGNPNLVLGSGTAATSTNKWIGHSATGGNVSTLEYDGDTPCIRVTRDDVAQTSWDYLSYERLLQSQIKTNTTYTITFDCKPSADGSIGFTGFSNGNATNYLTASTTNVQNNCYANKWNHMIYRCVTKSSFDGITIGGQVVYFSRSASLRAVNVSVLFKNIKVEEGDAETPWCPADSELDIDRTIIEDSSGYNHNGTIVGSAVSAADTARYGVSTHIDGAGVITATSPGADIRTLSCWVKTTKNKSTSQMLVADSASNMCISFYSGTIIGVFGTTRSTGSKCTLGASYKENDWNHIVVVKTSDDGKRDIYCNGEKLTPAADDYWSATAGFFVGNRNGTVSGNTPFFGYISDVRAYCTQLLDTDIKQLYNVGMKVDKKQNIHAFEFNETAGRTQFLKTGVIKSAQVADNLLFDNKAHIGKHSYENILPNNVNIVTTKNGHITNQNTLASIPAAKIQSLAGKTLRFTYDVKADGTRSSAENNQTAWNYIRYGIHATFQYTNASGTTGTSYPFAGDLAYSGAAKRSTQTWTVPTGYQSYGALGFSIQTFDKPASTNNETWFIQNVRLEVIDNTIDGYITGTQLIEK